MQKGELRSWEIVTPHGRLRSVSIRCDEIVMVPYYVESDLVPYVINVWLTNPLTWIEGVAVFHCQVELTTTNPNTSVLPWRLKPQAREYD